MIPRIIKLAWKSIAMHRLRSLLTVLGIIFGVGSVIAMLAIGEGASQAALEQIRRMGSRNLLLSSVPPPQEENASASNQPVSAYGLLRDDIQAIRETIPDIAQLVARRDVPSSEARHGTRKVRTTLMGTHAGYMDVANLRLSAGRFLSTADGESRRPVCVLGGRMADRLFSSRNPVGERVRIGRYYYEIVGVLALRGEGTGGTGGSGGESDDAIFVPLESMQERYGDTIRQVSSGSRSYERVELHRITIEATELNAVRRMSKALARFLERTHKSGDVKLTVPLDLLREAEETKRRSTILLGSIAAISLLVGGIGIMNIMLATVVERTREIGVRRALGARRSHIIRQFLAETVLLTCGGGVLGVAAGVALPLAITRWLDTPTVVTPSSLVIAFGISGVVGLIFGIYPAAQAADLDPVEALRHE